MRLTADEDAADDDDKKVFKEDYFDFDCGNVSFKKCQKVSMKMILIAADRGGRWLPLHFAALSGYMMLEIEIMTMMRRRMMMMIIITLLR